jgi:hypothetical protein
MNPLQAGFKALLYGLIAGAFGFFGGVFLGLVVLAMISGVAGARQDYTLSYRFVGAGLGIILFVAGFVTSIFRDLKAVSRDTDENSRR